MQLADYLAAVGEGDPPHPRATLVSLRHNHADPLELWIEPWGDHVYLDPEVDYVLVAHDPHASGNQPAILVAWDHGAVKVWAQHATTTLRVFRAGVLVWE